MRPLHERVQTDGGEPPHSVALNRGLARRLITAARLVASNTALLDGVHSLCIPASYKSVRLQRLRSLAAPGGFATFAGMDDDQLTAEAARRKLATVMIDKLLNRLPSHTRTQRLALLQQAFSEMRHRCFSQPDPVELDAAGKPTPASSAEQAFTEVGDVLLDQMAAILDG